MRILRWVLIVLAVLIVAGFAAFPYLKEQTKKSSPQTTATYSKNGLELSVAYSQPYKKGREIFGGLVPYGETWRTGANEATVFTTNRDLVINGKTLPAGEYTLWTVPNKDSWEIMFNDGTYGWGVSVMKGGKASHNPEEDVIVATVPVQNRNTVTEQFVIDFEDTDALMLTMTWDQTKVALPLGAL